MIKKLQCLLSILLFLVLSSANAARNPIAWSQSGSLPATSFIGNSYSATFTFISNFPFTMPTALTINKNVSSNSEFSFVDNCSGLKLTPGQSCSVTETLAPTTSGTKNVILTMNYDGTSVPLPTQSSATDSTTSSHISNTVLTALPSTISLGSTHPVSFQFTNDGNATAENIVQTNNYPTGFVQTTDTCTTTLAASASCIVSGNFTPTTTGSTSVGVTLTHDGSTDQALSSTSTTVSTTDGVTGSVVEKLPSTISTTANASVPVAFQFTNNGGVAVTGITITKTYPAGFSQTVDNCSTLASLGAGSSCQIAGSFSPTSVGTKTISVTFAYSSGATGSVSLTTSTTAVAGSSGRTFNLVNNCAEPVWFSFVGGAIPGSPNCTKDDDCPAGTTCGTAAAGGKGLCFYTDPTPSNNSLKLSANGGTATVSVPDYNNGNEIVWSGILAGRAGCADGKCAIADCEGGNGGDSACGPGNGFAQPATQVEFTLQHSSDFYDVEDINGFSIPTAMSPDNPVFGSNPYNCGSPGSIAPHNPELASCNWTFQTPSPSSNYIWVKAQTNPSAHQCTANSDCASGEFCGLSQNVGVSPIIQKTCGQFLGYWSVNQLCSFPTNWGVNDFFPSCVEKWTPIPPTSPPTSYSFTQLYACKPPNPQEAPLNTCYAQYGSNESSCCGCVNWNSIGIKVPSKDRKSVV